MPDTIPVTLELRYGTIPNVDPSALCTNRLKVIKATIAPGRVLALENTCAAKLFEQRSMRSKHRQICMRTYHYKNTCPCGILWAGGRWMLRNKRKEKGANCYDNWPSRAKHKNCHINLPRIPKYALLMSEKNPPNPRAKRFIQPNNEAIAAAASVVSSNSSLKYNAALFILMIMRTEWRIEREKISKWCSLCASMVLLCTECL